MPLLNPVFLLAAAAIGIPVWLHLSRRRKYREIDLGTLRFLRQALRERRKRWRLEEIPLLLLRVAALLLIAIIFARPYWPRPRNVDKASETLVLLDASGSISPEMAKAARAAAARALSKAGETKVQLAQFSDEVEPLASLDTYHPIAGAPKRLDVALGWALDHFLLEGSAAGKIVLIAHLAANSLATQPPRVWPPQVSVEIAPLEPPTVDNAAVRRITLLTPYVDKEMEIEARVWLPPGRTSDEDRTVTLDAGELHQMVLVPPGSERAVFRFPTSQPEVHGTISVRGGDPWPDDDKRPFAVRWTEPARVLLVDGQPGATPFEGQAYFIDKALSASGAAHGKSPFKPEIIYALEARNGLVDLSGVRAIALCGITELSPNSARALAEFVRGGGGLISVLNDKWTPEATADLSAAGLFPEAITFTNGNEKRALAVWDRNYPALREFDGRDGGDLRELEWRDAFAAKPGEGWRAVATLDGGHPLLLEKENAGDAKGRVLVLTHPLNRNWTDVPRDPLFVPFVKNLFGVLGNVAQAAEEIPVYAPGAQRREAIGWHDLTGKPYVIAPDSDVALVATASESAFRAAYGLPTADAAPPAAAPIVTHDEGAERSRPGEFWPWLMLGLLILLAIENIVATRKAPIPA